MKISKKLIWGGLCVSVIIGIVLIFAVFSVDDYGLRASYKVAIIQYLGDYCEKNKELPSVDKFSAFLTERSPNKLKALGVVYYYSPNGYTDNNMDKWHLVLIDKKKHTCTMFNVRGEDKITALMQKTETPPTWVTDNVVIERTSNAHQF